ncbi:hypothetical protein H4S03_001737 [Coemansia sp. S3946]|nr:hypothetical protein H4S03_001737 [Coemansia sp. S3946]
MVLLHNQHVKFLKDEAKNDGFDESNNVNWLGDYIMSLRRWADLRAGEEEVEDEEDVNQGIGVVVDQDQVVGEEWEEDPGADVAGDLVTASTTKITGKVQTQRQAAADERPQLIEAATARLLDAVLATATIAQSLGT